MKYGRYERLFCSSDHACRSLLDDLHTTTEPGLRGFGRGGRTKNEPTVSKASTPLNTNATRRHDAGELQSRFGMISRTQKCGRGFGVVQGDTELTLLSKRQKWQKSAETRIFLTPARLRGTPRLRAPARQPGESLMKFFTDTNYEMLMNEGDVF